MSNFSDELNSGLNHNKNQEFKRLLDFIFIVMLVAVGCVGLALVYKNDNPGLVVNSSAYLFRGEKEGLTNVKDNLPTLAHSFKTKGHLETKSTIDFYLTPFDKDAVYTIYFGDGNAKKMTSGHVSHQYLSASIFRLKIVKEKNGKREVVTRKRLNIGEQPIDKGEWGDVSF